MRYMFLMFISIFWIKLLYAQYPAGHIPYADRLNWSEAGLIYKSKPEIAQRIINFKTDSTAGIGEDDEKMTRVLDNITGDGLTIIYFPEGEYAFYNPVIINKDRRSPGRPPPDIPGS